MTIKFAFLLSFLFPLFLQSQELPASFRDFSGGINDNVATVALKPNESLDAMNVVIDEPWGNLKTRNGSLTCGYTPSGNQVASTYEYVRNSGNRGLILTDNVTVWETADCVNFSTITTGLSSSAQVYFDTFRDKLWITNKSTHPITWDGTTAVSLDQAGTKPGPVHGQYITHWKERVWMANTTEPSAVYFTSLTDIDGVNIDPSISSQAWPSSNAFYISQEDGSPIYGMKVFKDNLFIFKATGIWRILFESVYNTQVVKTVSNVGCKFQDSIVELDNFLYFVGDDGIYKFDGNDVVRISDNINTTFKKLKQPSRAESYRLWDTEANWNTGTFSNVTSSYTLAPGSLSLLLSSAAYTVDDFTDGNYTTNPTWTKTVTGTTGGEYITVDGGKLTITNYNDGQDITCNVQMVSTVTNQSAYFTFKASTTLTHATYSTNHTYFQFLASTNSIWNNGYALHWSVNPTQIPTLKLERYDNSAVTVLTNVTCNNTGGTNSYAFVVDRALNGLFTVSDSKGGCPTATATDATYSTGTNVVLYNISTLSSLDGATQMVSTFDNIIISSGGFFQPGVYTSQVSTATDLTVWKTFNTDETSNAQTIIHQIRTNASASAVSTSTYKTITSGVVISTTTDTYSQWLSSFSTTKYWVTPTLNSVSENWITGDISATRLGGIGYNNRYMITASTTPATSYNDIVLVKSKSPLDTWSIYDWQITSFAKWNNNLYGGKSNSSNILRLDYGSNDDGVPINSYWTWGDTHFGQLAYKKTLYELYLYYIPTNGINTLMQYSRDGGTIWNTLPVNFNTTGSFGTKRLLFNGGNANAFRFRVKNNTLDERFNFIGFDAFATPYKLRE